MQGVGIVVPILLFSCIPKTSRADILIQIDPGARRVVPRISLGRALFRYAGPSRRGAPSRRPRCDDRITQGTSSAAAGDHRARDEMGTAPTSGAGIATR